MEAAFDELSKALASATSRRQVLKLFSAGIASRLFAGSDNSAAAPCSIRTVTIWLEVFIPQSIPGVTKDVPGSSTKQTMIEGPYASVGGDCYLTDQRSFSSDFNKSARLHSRATVELASGTIVSQENFCTPTHGVDCGTGSGVGHCATPATPRGPGFTVRSMSVTTPKVISLDLNQYAANPCVHLPSALTPDLDCKGRIGIEVLDPSRVRVTFEGEIDVFPAYEMWASADGGPAQWLFQEGPVPGAKPWSLVTGNLTRDLGRKSIELAGPTGGSPAISFRPMLRFGADFVRRMSVSFSVVSIGPNTGYAHLSVRLPRHHVSCRRCVRRSCMPMQLSRQLDLVHRVMR